ncbi:MAG: pyrroloquinoline quinone precursor peptide PqqA [Bacillati bacterium ANGP1]|uniref:Coenzyme PQQ synthesis protein A n=1 Tax=Candidatus Segetimicrobium genomatis TaxID=2569760 RepID=A0A537K401_9BACT|nr:MAG: pyrroloquinoline quinone precursor peptide PqqA [Terrabacteria group bacterium ANGP1]
MDVARGGGDLGMWIKPWFEEVSLCAEVTAYVYTK